MADTRAVLLGMGIVLVIVGLFVSNLVCGVGFLFILLGLVIWPREEDEAVPRESKSSLRLPGGVPVRSARSRRRRLALRGAIAAGVVVVAAVGGYLLYGQPTTILLTGIQISAPAGDCWNGTVGSGASSGSTGVGGCGPGSVSLTCVSAMWANVSKTTPGGWTLAVTGYRSGTSLGTESVSSELGAVQVIFMC